MLNINLKQSNLTNIMLKKYIFLLFVLSITFSCSEEKKDDKTVLIDKIEKLEKDCFDDSSNSYNHNIALKTLVEYQVFINKFPNDSLSEEYLYISAQLSKSINLYGESVRKYELFIQKYPESKNAEKAKFMIGMIYENDIKDTIKAKEAYTSFIETYPNNKLVPDAEFLITNLSLTDEELINLLESKN